MVCDARFESGQLWLRGGAIGTRIRTAVHSTPRTSGGFPDQMLTAVDADDLPCDRRRCRGNNPIAAVMSAGSAPRRRIVAARCAAKCASTLPRAMHGRARADGVHPDCRGEALRGGPGQGPEAHLGDGVGQNSGVSFRMRWSIMLTISALRQGFARSSSIGLAGACAAKAWVRTEGCAQVGFDVAVPACRGGGVDRVVFEDRGIVDQSGQRPPRASDARRIRAAVSASTRRSA